MDRGSLSEKFHVQGPLDDDTAEIVLLAIPTVFQALEVLIRTFL